MASKIGGHFKNLTQIFMKNSLAILSLVFLAFSCNEKQETFDSFEIESLYSKRLNVSDSIRFSADLLFVNDFLVISDYDGLDFLKIIDVKSDKVIKSFGRKGEGPCEIQANSNIQKIGSSSVGVHVKPDLNYVEFNLENLDSIYCQNETTAFDYNFQKLVKLEEGRFFGSGIFEGRYALTNNQDYKIDSVFLEYPFQKDLSISFGEMAMLFQGNFTIQHQIQRLAFATMSSKALDIFSFEDNKIKVIKRFFGNELPVFTSLNDGVTVKAPLSGNNVWGYLSISSSNFNIYLLHSGRRTDDNYNKSNVVLVYDWDGNPVRRFELDQEVSIIAVDELGKKLVGYIDDGRSNFYVFDL